MTLSRYWQDVHSAEHPKVLAEVVSKRRQVLSSVPNLDIARAHAVKTALFSKYNLREYIQQVSGEMHPRPIPHVSEEDEMQHRFRSAYVKYAPSLIREMVKVAEPPTQTYNKVSRVGWPFFNRPISKAEVAFFAFNQAEKDISYLRDSFTITNVRLQPEPVDKVRNMQFVDDRGVVTDREVDLQARSVYVPQLGKDMACQRTRLIFNRAANNLALQPVDSMINNALSVFPVCKHNMFATEGSRPVRRYVLAFDVSHMERLTAALIEARTNLIGGPYMRQHNAMDAGGFCVRSATGKSWWHLKRAVHGKIVQFGSGHSAVAPSQKEGLLCVFIALHVEHWGMSVQAAVQAVLSANTPWLHIMNYGDDNFLSAHDPAILKTAFDFIGKYLPIQVEDPPRFLGFEWTHNRKFVLTVKSYLLKTYLHERSPVGAFRKFPNFGWVEKRRTYLRHGNPTELVGVFDRENEELEKVGLPWKEVELKAEQEQHEASRFGLTPDALFGKDYLMTAEQLLATGGYDGIGPDVTGPFLRRVLSEGIYADITKDW